MASSLQVLRQLYILLMFRAKHNLWSLCAKFVYICVYFSSHCCRPRPFLSPKLKHSNTVFTFAIFRQHNELPLHLVVLSHEKGREQFLMYYDGSDVNKREIFKSGVNVPKPWVEDQCPSLQRFAPRLRCGRCWRLSGRNTCGYDSEQFWTAIFPPNLHIPVLA
jgi:hypothetical protein